MTAIDQDKALSLLAQAVDERGPNFVYEPVTSGGGHACKYQHNGAPSCGVGLALHIAGAPIQALVDMDLDEYDTGINMVAWVLKDYGITLTSEAVAVLSRFQEKQDRSTPWGIALQEAKEVAL